MCNVMFLSDPAHLQFVLNMKPKDRVSNINSYGVLVPSYPGYPGAECASSILPKRQTARRTSGTQ